MIVIGWNVRGLGQSRAFPIVRELVCSHKADILCLVETLVDANKIKELRVYLRFFGAFAVNCSGHSSGLAILWRNHDDVSVTKYATTFIDVEIKSGGVSVWRLTC